MAAVSERAKENRKKYLSDWYFLNKQKISEKAKKRYQQNRESVLARQKNTQRPYLYKKLYGISIDEYDAMAFSQGNRCALCGTDTIDKNGRRKFWCVDHCHLTGLVRGLLCVSCNQFLGKYERLHEQAEIYLKGHDNA